MPSASDDVRAAIAAAEPTSPTGRRAIPFDRFMEIALYGPNGFYTSGGSAGRRGDFITGPEVGPLFGAVLGRALDSWWRELGRPDVFTVVDAGAGPGTLARSVRAGAPACLAALRYVAVEVSAAQRTLHPEGIESVPAMPTEPFVGVIIANELLDNLSFRLFVMDGGWREAHAVSEHDGTFAEILVTPPDLAQLGLPTAAPHGARIPVQQVAVQWVRGARDLLEGGRLVLIDYTAPSTAALAVRPWREWLRTYRGHDRGDHYLRRPGTQDITADVALDQLARGAGEPDAVRTQSQFLQRWGITDLVIEGRRVWAEQAARPTLAAMTMRSRIAEAEALLAEPGLGSFSVVEYGPTNRTVP